MARGRMQGRWTKARSAAVMSTTDKRTSDTLALFAGNANPALAQDIAKGLQAPLGRIYVGRFSDGEINIELMENVRGRDVFIVQSTCPPANESLMELLVMVDACRRASAARITAVVPYFGYSRQDRRIKGTRAAITAKLVANMLSSAGTEGGGRREGGGLHHAPGALGRRGGEGHEVRAR